MIDHYNIHENKNVIVPKTGTKVEMASGTLLITVFQPPIAKVVAQTKNMLALQISIQKILLYIKVPMNIAFSCSSLLMPFVINPAMKAITPMIINTIDHVFIFGGISKCSFTDDAIVIFFRSYNFYLVPAFVLSVAAGTAAVAR